MSQNRAELVEMNGWKGYAYYAIFPLDTFAPDTRDRLAYQQTKLEELLPVYLWLLPLIVLLTGATTTMGGFGFLVFLSLEAFLLALLTKFHLKLAWNQVVEIWLNLWASMAGMALIIAVFAFFFGSMASPTIDWN